MKARYRYPETAIGGCVHSGRCPWTVIMGKGVYSGLCAWV